MHTDSNIIDFSIIKIRLDGPFVVLLNRSAGHPHHIGGITAFVPSDPADTNPRHLGYFYNGDNDRTSLGMDDGTENEFTLKPGGLEPFVVPNIHSCFDEFTLHAKCKPPETCFLRLNLPCPDRILLTRGFAPVSFERDSHLGLMPLNHVLEYQVHHPNTGITLYNEKTKKDIYLHRAADTFMFEVGLKKPDARTAAQDPEEQEHRSEHAVNFFNEVVLTCFENSADKRLASIQTVSPANGQLSILSTDVECSNGGVVGQP
jgi:hypothetical protein